MMSDKVLSALQGLVLAGATVAVLFGVVDKEQADALSAFVVALAIFIGTLGIRSWRKPKQ